MITIATAENALKNIYLDTVVNDINRKTNPFLTMVEENARTVSGKDTKFSIRYGQAAVGTGAETGDLPAVGGEKSLEVSVPLKNMYGTFQVSDKALKAASTDPNAFASLLGGEMQNLVSAAQSNITSMLYGDGRKLLAVVDSSKLSTDRKTFTVKASEIGNFKSGMQVRVYNNGGMEVSDVLEDNEITVNTTTCAVTLDTAVEADKTDRYYIYDRNDDGTTMNGIDSVFMTSMYGINTNLYPEIKPCDYRDNGTLLKVLNEEAALEFLDAYEEHCQSMPADIILTHPRVKKAIFESLKSTRSNIATAELAGGFRGFTFNGIPLYSDVKCHAGCMYALDSKSFAMHQLCDWTWLSNEDGSILKQLPGKATYMATLVKYADLICDKPFLQGRCSRYACLKWK